MADNWLNASASPNITLNQFLEFLDFEKKYLEDTYRYGFNFKTIVNNLALDWIQHQQPS